MNKRAMAILVAVLSLIGLGAGTLRQVEKSRRLGAAPLLMTAGEVLDEGGFVISTNMVALPERVLEYESTNSPITRVELEMLPKDTLFTRRLYQTEGGFSLMAGVVMMGLDRSSIHKPQYCLVGQGWKVLSEGEDSVALAGEVTSPLPVWRMTAERTQILPDGTQRLVKAVYVYWFVADGYVTARHEQRMWWMARELLTTGTLQRWAYVSVLGLCLPGQEEETYARLKEFIAESTPQYHRFDESTRFDGAD